MQSNIEIIERSIVTLREDLDSLKSFVGNEISKWNRTNKEIEHDLKNIRQSNDNLYKLVTKVYNGLVSDEEFKTEGLFEKVRKIENDVSLLKSKDILEDKIDERSERWQKYYIPIISGTSTTLIIFILKLIYEHLTK